MMYTPALIFLILSLSMSNVNSSFSFAFRSNVFSVSKRIDENFAERFFSSIAFLFCM